MGFLWEIYNSLEGNEVPADGKMIPDGRNGYKRRKMLSSLQEENRKKKKIYKEYKTWRYQKK